MVKNFGGGNKAKRKGRKNFRGKTFSLDDLKASNEDNQEYGYVTEKYGDGRYELMCYDKVTRKATVRGAIKQKCRLDKGGLVLISMRDFQDTHSDILYVYTDDDKEKLVNANVICESFTKTGKLSTEDDDVDNQGDTVMNTDNVAKSDIKSYASDEEAWASDESVSDMVNVPKPKNSLEEVLDELELDIDDI
mgnify:CR=1 FL=1|jgi:initiation factor 1A